MSLFVIFCKVYPQYNLQVKSEKLGFPQTLEIKFSCYTKDIQNTISSALFCFLKSKQIICFLEGCVRQKRVRQRQKMFLFFFGQLSINNKQCPVYLDFYAPWLSEWQAAFVVSPKIYGNSYMVMVFQHPVNLLMNLFSQRNECHY